MFLIHPTDLRRRRARCKPIVDRIVTLERELAPWCNVCGSKQNVIISSRDRYGFPARSAMCLNCGLIYVVDRFTLKGYSEFYGQGIYRALISCLKGKKQTIQRIQAAQVNYAARLIGAMQGYISSQKGGRLLDIGGSTGLVAREFVNCYDFIATVLDPAPDEIAAAKVLGLDAVVGSIEDWNTQERFDLILLCRTIEHLFDLRGALSKIRNLLYHDGLFYCDIADFTEICRREGPPEATTKIDHCYWLCQETAPGLFRSLGFEIVSMHITLPPDQVGFLLRPCQPAALHPVSMDWIQCQVRRFREIESEWQQYGRTPYDAFDWLRQKAYRIKKGITG